MLGGVVEGKVLGVAANAEYGVGVGYGVDVFDEVVRVFVGVREVACFWSWCWLVLLCW